MAKHNVFIIMVALIGTVFFMCSDKSPTDPGNNNDPSSTALYDQVDRDGIPLVNDVFNHFADTAKRNYNLASPSTDVALNKKKFKTFLDTTKSTNPDSTALIFLPDELPMNLASTCSDFAALNGRKLSDDATDDFLSIIMGPPYSFLRSDHVNSNDVPFRKEFPYLASPHH